MVEALPAAAFMAAAVVDFTAASAVAVFAGETLVGPVSAVAALVEIASAAIGSITAGLTIGSSSLTILTTHSFTIPIHTTDTIRTARTAIIPTAIILTGTVTDMLGFAAAVSGVAVSAAVAFITAVFAMEAFMTTPCAAEALVAVGDCVQRGKRNFVDLGVIKGNIGDQSYTFR